MFPREFVDYGKVTYTNCTVHVYRSYHDRVGLLLPCGTVLSAMWMGCNIHVQMSNGWTYVYTGLGSHTSCFPTR